jgi:protocatechuate 3,4-dioxygenase beta subunit
LSRRSTCRIRGAMDYLAYKFDIVLRGRRQTMFENRPEGM